MKNMPKMPKVEKGSELSESLSTPGHLEEKVKIINAGEDNSSETEVPKTASSGIEVVALRKGFYNQLRISEGAKFTVTSMEKLGEWMRCVDPTIEKAHQKMIREKKARK